MTPNRKNRVQHIELRTQTCEWFVEFYPQLSEAAYTAHPALLAWDCDKILDDLARRVPACRCRSRDTFLRWCRGFVRRRAQQIRDLEALLTEYRRVIYSAILKANNSKSEDCAIDADDVFSEVAALLCNKMDDLQKEGIAKLSTRLYGLARRHTLSYHTTKRNRRLKLTTEHYASGGEIAGAFPPEELAEMKYLEEAASSHS